MNIIKRIIDLWFAVPQAIRFIFTGGYNTAVGYILFIAALWLFGPERYQLALLSSYIVSSFNSYLAQKFFVFRTRGNYAREYFKALSVWILGYFINAGILYLLIERSGLNPYLAQLTAICCVTVITYVLFKHYSFRRAAK